MSRMKIRERILVVDDEELVSQVLTAQLEIEGYQVETAANGEEAINVLQQKAFELIFLDLKMPKIDGIGVLDFIKNNPERLLNSQVKVVMLSAFGEFKNCVETKKRGAVDFLSKPYDLVDLLTTVEQVLRKEEKLVA